jgi:uncharacterized membrane protein
MRGWALPAALAILLAATLPAQAALKLCNRTSYVLYAATASLDAGNVRSQGWIRLAPGDCRVPVTGDLIASQYFVYARSSLAHSGPARAWGGNTSLCVKDPNFILQTPLNASHCAGDDSFARPFATLDTHHMRSWTMSFDDAPPETGMAAARSDGLNRLLRDNAIRPGDSAALAALRKRLHLAAGANSAQLFDALETEALKNAGPSGYTLCNDSPGMALVALGQRVSAGWSARGWWKIAPGSCGKLLSDKLSTDALYLLAERPDGRALVGGAEKFCVTTIEFEVQGRDHCRARGLADAGFARIDVRGIAGLVGHIGAEGLIPAPHPARMSK